MNQRAPVSRIVPEVMAELRAMTREYVFRYLPDQEPRAYLYDLVRDYPARGGRGMRPSICLATARVFGAPYERALPTAASIELMHNAMLIHDDIQDESEFRRGKPTLHSKEGVPLALNAGDTLSLLALRPLMDNQDLLGPSLTRRIMVEAERMARESAEGQALELGWRRDNDMTISVEDYLRMVYKKTCWLATVHPVRVGALIGTHGRMDADRFLRFGCLLGAAFQIQDDLLNLIGNAQAYGKELGGDILEGKRTLMMIRLLEQATPAERAAYQTLFASPRGERSDADVHRIMDDMLRYDCIEYARSIAHGLAGAAMHEAEQLFGALPDSRERQFLLALPHWVIERA